jgi:cellobiose phosphorylase
MFSLRLVSKRKLKRQIKFTKKKSKRDEDSGWCQRGSERDEENLQRKREKETKIEMRERSQKNGDDGERDREERK